MERNTLQRCDFGPFWPIAARIAQLTMLGKVTQGALKAIDRLERAKGQPGGRGPDGRAIGFCSLSVEELHNRSDEHDSMVWHAKSVHRLSANVNRFQSVGSHFAVRKCPTPVLDSLSRKSRSAGT